MVNLEKVPKQIKTDGLFSYIYDEMLEESGKKELDEKQIRALLLKYPKHLDEYRKLNKDIEISNIHLKEFIIEQNENDEFLKIKTEINKNAETLRALEKYSLGSNDSAYPIWIGSLAVFGIFTIHNFFGLFTDVYRSFPALIYGAYIFIIFYAYYMYKKTLKNHDEKNLQYKELFKKTQQFIDSGVEKGYFKRSEIYE